MNNMNYGVVFPGQGSQSIGMLADLAPRFASVASVFNEASDVLGYDLWALVQAGPKEKLDQTEYTQPALLAASYATWKILTANVSHQPAMLAGHSLGEYTALVCANALRFADAVKLVAARGKFMQEAVKKDEGAMAALIGLDVATVDVICKQAIVSTDDVLSPANYNSIGQIVVAGHHGAVVRAIALAKEHGAKMAVLIPVSVPSHCALMKPAADKLAAMLRTVAMNEPSIPVVNNVDVKTYRSIDDIKDALVRQLYMPVRWVEIIEKFIQSGITEIVECGPGKVLTGLNKRINKSLSLKTTGEML